MAASLRAHALSSWPPQQLRVPTLRGRRGHCGSRVLAQLHCGTRAAAAAAAARRLCAAPEGNIFLNACAGEQTREESGGAEGRGGGHKEWKIPRSRLSIPLTPAHASHTPLMHSAIRREEDGGGGAWGWGGDLLVSVYLPPHPSPPTEERSERCGRGHTSYQSVFHVGLRKRE